VVTARALERVVRAVTADQFGVEARAVSADLRDEGGRLDVAVRTPVRVVSISRFQTDPGSLERSGGTIVERAERSEAAIIDQVGTITGSTVSKLAVRFTDADIKQERRVR
jgi:hypothetical protein